MRGVLVALDLETTGLNPGQDRIIEIGAARFRDQHILETYTTLVDPGIAIPPRITAITGIRTEALAGAPKIGDVLPAVAAFVGDSPVVGHNVEFDLRFLQQQGILNNHPAIDTYELASLLLPTAARYNLNALMQILNIAPEGDYHRAETDAIAHARLYMALWQSLMHTLPVELLREIAALGQARPEWGGRLPFEAAARAREGERAHREDRVMRAFATGAVSAPKPPVPPVSPLPVLETLLAAVAPDHRSPDMLRETAHAVSEALISSGRQIIETPGSDSAPAYLASAALHAMQHGEQVTIAVGSASLRREIIDQHIPALQQALGGALRVALLRRRLDYLCPARLEIMRRRRPENVEELRLLAKTLIWLGTGADLDSVSEADRLSIRGPGEHTAWARLSAQAEGCPRDRCETQMGGRCPLFAARQAAASAHLIIVDQGMLVADAASHDPIIPAYKHLIVDEAFLLEDATTEALHRRLDAASMRRRAAELGSIDHGLLAEVLAETRSALPEKTFDQLAAGIRIVASAALQMNHHVRNLFRAMQAFLESVADLRPGDFAIQVRLTANLRSKPAFGQVGAAWSILSQFTEALGGQRGTLAQLVARLRTFQSQYDLPGLLGLTASLEGVARDLEQMHTWCQACIATPGENTIYWAEIATSGADGGDTWADRITLHSAPLHVGTLLERYVWARGRATVLLGTALRVGERFSYVQSRLGAQRFSTHTLAPGTASELLILLPDDMPEPTDREQYPRSVERAIIELAAAVPGRLMALFTSMTQLRQSGQLIAKRLDLGNIPVFDQSDGTGQSALLEGFRASEKGVLLGVRGFWEDVAFEPGDLRTLVVVRLPFAVPNEPVFAARTETFEDALNQYTVPHAVTRFRHTFERVMRGCQGRGVVAILDRRMTSRDYGQTFLDGLPPSTIRRMPLAELASAARDWLRGE